MSDSEPRIAGSEGQFCSNCGSDDPKHVAYVLERGVCVS